MTILQTIDAVEESKAFDELSWKGDTARRLNLIYGWNASGKTTIARLLRTLEPGADIPSGFHRVRFKLDTEGGVVTHADRDSPPITFRVFNEDFIGENLSFSEGSAKPIVMVGKASKALEAEIKTLEQEIQHWRTQLEKHQATLDALPSLETILTRCGQKVTDEFAGTPLASGDYGGRRYRRPQVESLIDESEISAETISSHIVSGSVSLQSLREKVSGDIATVRLTTPDLNSIQAVFNTANELLSRSIAVKRIERLEEDTHLREWVRGGLRLHEERDSEECLFCERRLQEDRLQLYGQVFTDEVTSAEAELAECRRNLNQLIEALTVDWPDSGDWLADLRKPFIEQRDQCQALLDQLTVTCGELRDRLALRVGAMHVDGSQQKEVAFPSSVVVAAQEAANGLATLSAKQADQVTNLESERNRAARKLELHIVSEVLQQAGYFENEQSRTKTTSERDAAQSEVDGRVRAVQDKRAELRDVGIALTEINELVAAFLGPEEVVLEGRTTDEDPGALGYRILNRGEQAEYLSEGEKSVIALAYFLVKLQEDGLDPGQTVVVLDDPVDSQDSNFLYRTVGLLQRRLSEIGQVFIFTHNFDLFNLVRDWFTGRQSYPDARLYLLEMSRGADSRTCVLRDLPDLLRQHKTEYQYLVSRLVEYQKDTTSLHAPLVPNVARKVLEYFSSFKWCCNTSEGLPNIVQNRFIRTQDRRKNGIGDALLKFLNEYSHGRDFSRPVTSSVMEAGDICENVLEFIRLSDEDHFRHLVREIETPDSAPA